ncbi:MAG TPA: hypothetical protein VGL81_23170 [Polyangiaceae bacterium]
MTIPIKLRIRNLQTREAGVAAFETDAEAFLWLKDRPRFVEVIGMAGQVSVPMEVQDRLRAAMRPLDDEERIAERETELALEKEDLERDKVAREKEAEMQAKHQAELRAADPERLMEVKWRFNADMALTDPHDPRTITDDARAAILAWIAERNEWVAGRGQTIGECTVKVWPGKLPSKDADRVKEGRFVPVSHEEKK